MADGSIDLAHTPDFHLAGLQVCPSTRELVAHDHKRVTLEPRVMQVLVALGRSPGTIWSRDDLTRECWSGRIVGEDAINRVLSRLRRVAEGPGENRFRIETVTKVGYRLIVLDGSTSGRQPNAHRSATAEARSTAMAMSRRFSIGGGVAAILGAAGGGYLLFGRSSALEQPAPSPETAVLMDQASDAFSQSTREGQNQAFGLYRRVVAISPDFADGWGMLALAYASTAPFRRSSEGEALRSRAVQAARRAIALDPENSVGYAALAMVAPHRGGWLALEQALRVALAGSPNSIALLNSLAATLAQVGRAAEALLLYERAAQLATSPTPALYYNRIRTAWASSPIEQTDALITEATGIFPTHFAIWFARCYILIYSGRPAEAIALCENQDGRPTGITPENFAAIVRVARAFETRDPAAIDRVVNELTVQARAAAGHAENGIQFASALGRLDDAFAIAGAYYFSRGYEIPELRFTLEQGTYTPMRERHTAFLFMPSTARMRADPRFTKLTEEIGLADYWAKSGTTPDYRRQA